MKKKQCFDQLGRLVDFNFPPQRIVSLVPSQTELLFDLGLGDRVVGITKFCVHPKEWFNSKTIIGGTKKFHFDLIYKLNPDLVLGNKEENYQEGIAQLEKKYPTWMSDVVSWDSVLQLIKSIGELVDEKAKADILANEVNTKFEKLKLFSFQRVLYLIWRNPWMAVGKKTFIDTMLSKIGLENCIVKERYPELHIEDLKKLSPEIIFLSSEPFPFQKRNVEELQQHFPATKIILVDGEMFSWYGSRLLKAADYFSVLSL